MKICYLADANSTHTRKWCQYFLEKHYDIHVISFTYGEIEGVTVHSLELDKAEGGLMAKFGYILKIGQVRKLIRRIKPDIVHAHYASSYGLLGACSGFHPFAISVWGSDVYEFPYQNALTRWIVKHNLKKADHLLSTSVAMSLQAGKFTDKPFIITPFGVDTNIFTPTETEKDCFTVGIVKTLKPNYGLDTLIRGFSSFVNGNEDVNARLKIAGTGPEEENLKALCQELNVADRVEFMGYISGQERVAEAYNTMDVAVFPSIHESFGVAAVEAMACGVAVIVSEAEGLKEVVADGEVGLVVPIGDEKAIAKNLELLYHNTELRHHLACKGRQRVMEEYSITECFKGVEALYESIRASEVAI